MEAIKKFLSIVLSLTMIFSISSTAFAVEDGNNYDHISSSQAQPLNPYSSPDSYIEYLESFDGAYSVFLSQFKALTLEKQQKVLDVLENGGPLDVKLSATAVNDSTQTRSSTFQRSVNYDADFQLFGIIFVTIRLEGRFTHSGSTVESVEYKNAYIVKNWVPLSGFQRTSLDAYVSNGKFYASSAFTAYVGAKIGDNIIGVTPRTFYINYNCDGTGQGTGSAW